MITSIVDFKKYRKLFGFSKNGVYILGAEYNSQMIAKSLYLSGIKVLGYISQDLKELDFPVITLDKFNNNSLKSLFFKNRIVAIENDINIKKINKLFNKMMILNIDFVNQIEKKVTSRKTSLNFEINIADHCNLNCQCCDHFSPIAEKKFLNIETFKNDLNRIKELVENNNQNNFKVNLSFVGGEPTLHPDLILFFKVAREIFQNANLTMVTNGILLLQLENSENGNLWQAMSDYNIALRITTYPVKVEYDKIDDCAKKYKLNYARYTDIGTSQLQKAKISINHIFTKNQKNVEPFEFLSCYQFNECTVLKEGKVYQCPLAAYVNHFNKYFDENLKITNKDFIDIYNVSSYDEIANFISSPAPFCKYCNVKKRYGKEFAISKKDISEWADFNKDNSQCK